MMCDHRESVLRFGRLYHALVHVAIGELILYIDLYISEWLSAMYIMAVFTDFSVEWVM